MVGELPHSDPSRRSGSFVPEVLDRTVIAIPLLTRLREEVRERSAGGEQGKPTVYPLILDLNLSYKGGVDAVAKRAEELIGLSLKRKATEGSDPQGINKRKSDLTSQYVFASLEGEVIKELVRLDNEGGSVGSGSHRSIFRIWPDFALKRLIHESVSTVKADAARASFSALGEGIVWAVMDSGIEQHRHFAKHENLKLPAPMEHQDFASLENNPLKDEFGHGTHVAGIIAGEYEGSKKAPIRAFARHRDEHGEVTYNPATLPSMSGMAPKCKLLSLKVLDGNGVGQASNLIAAMAYVQKINGYGRTIRIHGVNMSVGYDFEPEWFCLRPESAVR